MPVSKTSSDSNGLNQIQQTANRLEEMLQRFERGGLEQVVSTAVRRSQKQLEDSMRATLRDSLIGMIGSPTGRSGGGLLSLVGSFLPGFARGGVLSGRDMVARAGEAGPEAVLPLVRGRDGRLGVVATGPSSAQVAPVEITIRHENEVEFTGLSAGHKVPDTVLRDAVADALDQAMGDAIDTRLAQHLRPGGMLDRYLVRG
ncbi:hypothetical protein AB8880_02075 [Alphaproteobacteria bacterium LSUCC0684]